MVGFCWSPPSYLRQLNGYGWSITFGCFSFCTSAGRGSGWRHVAARPWGARARPWFAGLKQEILQLVARTQESSIIALYNIIVSMCTSLEEVFELRCLGKAYKGCDLRAVVHNVRKKSLPPTPWITKLLRYGDWRHCYVGQEGPVVPSKKVAWIPWVSGWECGRHAWRHGATSCVCRPKT